MSRDSLFNSNIIYCHNIFSLPGPSSKYRVLSDEDAAALKCSRCSCYLNVPPIKTSVDGNVLQCGRCEYNDPNIYVRNFAYEKVGKYMVFPCIYPGCSVKVSWNKVKQHEIECIHRTIICPCNDCGVVVLCSKIIEHFNECHKSAIISDVAVRFHKLDDGVALGLLVHDGNPYFCIFCSDGKLFRAGVYSIRALIPSKYSIELYTMTFQKRKFWVSGEKVLLFNDKLHCIRCYVGKCTSKLHRQDFFSKSNKFEMSTELEVDSLKSILKSATVCSKISIESNKIFKDNIENSDIIRRITECPICKEYMSSPIHFCQTGHIICSKCEKNVSKCPTCLAPFISARNYAVEELCSNVIISCQNNSCDFLGSLNELHEHEEDCDSKLASVVKEKLPWKFN